MDDFFAELEKAMAVAVIPPPEPEVQPVAQPIDEFWDATVGTVLTLKDVMLDSLSYTDVHKALEEELDKATGLDLAAMAKEKEKSKAITYAQMYGASKGKVIDLVGKPHIKLAKKGNTKKNLFQSEDWKGKKPK
jgi:hypothetical protein